MATSAAKARQTSHLLGGILFGLFGILMLGGGLYAITHPAPPKPAPVAVEKQDALACASTMRRLGYPATTDSGKVQVKSFSSVWQDTPQQELARVSLATRACYPGYVLEKFCMGASCPSGVDFTLQPKS